MIEEHQIPRLVTTVTAVVAIDEGCFPAPGGGTGWTCRALARSSRGDFEISYARGRDATGRYIEDFSAPAGVELEEVKELLRSVGF